MNIKKIKDNLPVFMESVTQANVAGSAAEMTYYLLLALFPVLLLVANIIPLLPIDSAMIIDLIAQFLPEQIEPLILPTLQDFLNSANPQVISVGFILSIWSASVAFNTLQNVLNRVYAVENTNNFIVTRLLSFLLAMVLVIGVGAVSMIFVFGQSILKFLGGFFPIPSELISLFTSLRWPALLIVLFLMLMYIYQIIPKHHYAIIYNIPGAILSSLLMLLLSSFFSLYVTYFGGSSVSNGTIGVFIVLMLYLYFSSIVLIVGALVNRMFYIMKNLEFVKEKSQKTTQYFSENYTNIYHDDVYRGHLTRKDLLEEE